MQNLRCRYVVMVTETLSRIASKYSMCVFLHISKAYLEQYNRAIKVKELTNSFTFIALPRKGKKIP